MRGSSASEASPLLRKTGATRQFVIELRQRGRVAFGLDELTRASGLSALAAYRQLTRTGHSISRVTPRIGGIERAAEPYQVELSCCSAARSSHCSVARH